MEKVTIAKINNIEDVKIFFGQLNDFLGLGWVPYDDFVDGFFNKAGETYTVEDGEKLNRLMDEAFDVCENENIDIADIGLEVNRHLRFELGIGIEEYELDNA